MRAKRLAPGEEVAERGLCELESAHVQLEFDISVAIKDSETLAKERKNSDAISCLQDARKEVMRLQNNAKHLT